MTPLEKAKASGERVNYCDECEKFKIVGNDAYCEADGKLIHPIMLIRGQGTGPSWNCQKRMKKKTHYELVISKTPEELAELFKGPLFFNKPWCPLHDNPCRHLDKKEFLCETCLLDWLKEEASDE